MDEEPNFEADFAGAVVSADELIEDSEAPSPPSMSDPNWSEYVMGQFAEGELDENGRPLVHGLRRVVRKVLGPIIESSARVVQPPSLPPRLEGLSIMQPAVVEYTVRVSTKYGLVTFSDAADAFHGNIGDIKFAAHLTAMAATRAESRALRKALQIKCIASEEASAVSPLETGVNGKIAPTQIYFIDAICSRTNINVVKFVNMGKNQYERIEDIPYLTAAKMVETLSGFQSNQSKIPESIRGYQKNWKENC